MATLNEVLNLIKLIRESFPDAEKVYTQGSCVQFCLILNSVYPQGEIYWNGHASFKLNGHFYDITGEISGEDFNVKLIDCGIMQINQILQLRYKK